MQGAGAYMSSLSNFWSGAGGSHASGAVSVKGWSMPPSIIHRPAHSSASNNCSSSSSSSGMSIVGSSRCSNSHSSSGSRREYSSSRFIRSSSNSSSSRMSSGSGSSSRHIQGRASHALYVGNNIEPLPAGHARGTSRLARLVNADLMRRRSRPVQRGGVVVGKWCW